LDYCHKALISTELLAPHPHWIAVELITIPPAPTTEFAASSLDTLHRHGNTHAATNAQRSQTPASLAAFHFIQQSD
jgi:hypothetical protein